MSTTLAAVFETRPLTSVRPCQVGLVRDQSVFHVAGRSRSGALPVRPMASSATACAWMYFSCSSLALIFQSMPASAPALAGLLARTEIEGHAAAAMSALAPTLHNLRQRAASAANDPRRSEELLQAVTEVTAYLEEELKKYLAGRELTIADPVIAANQDVRALLRSAVGQGGITGVKNTQRPVLAKDGVPQLTVARYHAEIARLARMVKDRLRKLLRWEVTGVVPGPLKLLVIDMTMNIKKVEHSLTNRLAEDLKARGVRLVGESPYLPMTFGTVVDILGTDELDWNALLLISHGRARSVSDGADPVRLGDIGAVSTDTAPPGNWWLINGAEMNIEDKFVFLAVCYGAGEDAEDVLLEHQLALTLTGPRQKLSGQEILDFFPPVFAELSGMSELTPEAVADVVVRNNTLAKNKMTTLPLDD